MKNVMRSVRNGHQKEFIKVFNTLGGRYGRWEIWADFVTMSAISIANTVDKVHSPEREKTYLHIAKKYKPGELQAFVEMLGLVITGMESNPDMDFLGELYMACELGNDNSGQFFTPYSVCQAMAAMSFSDVVNEVETRGWISVNDPACGAGALLVAFANQCKRKNVNYQTSVLFIAQDIDFTVGMMCYLQMSLLGCPGYVVIGDTLSHPAISYDKRGLIPKDTGNVWYTPFYFQDIWHWRRIAAQMDMLLSAPRPTESVETPQEQVGQTVTPPIEKKPRKRVATPVIAKEERKVDPQPSFGETQTGQLTFF